MKLGHDIVILTVAVYLGLVMTDLLKAISADLVMPLLAPILPSKNELGKTNIHFGSIRLEVGDVLQKLIAFIVAVSIALLVVKSIRIFGKDLIIHFYI